MSTDGRKGGYMIYYSLWNPEDGEAYDRMYYSYADESFTTLTKPKLLFDWGYATIDADINYLEKDGLYHMMIKKEGASPASSLQPLPHSMDRGASLTRRIMWISRVIRSARVFRLSSLWATPPGALLISNIHQIQSTTVYAVRMNI